MNTQRGLSLIELLVALAIGSFLIIGAVTVQSQTRRTFDVNEQQSRLQESARYVLSVIEPELQLAGLYGFSQDPNVVQFGTKSASELRQNKGAAPGTVGGMGDCGTNFAVDVLATVEAQNGAYTLTCAGLGGLHVASADTLILRHTSALPAVTVTSTRLQLFSNRLSPHSDTKLFVGDAAPDPLLAGVREVHDMVVQAYYLSADSDGHPGVPALRAKILDTVAGKPGFIDQEIIRGIEDLQVQFGVDPGLDLDHDGKADDPGGDGMADFVDGIATRWVSPGDALLSSAQIVAVRIWVRVRADQQEPGFQDDRVYQYGDTNVQPKDGYRRVLASRTVFLRNSRQQ